MENTSADADIFDDLLQNEPSDCKPQLPIQCLNVDKTKMVIELDWGTSIFACQNEILITKQTETELCMYSSAFNELGNNLNLTLNILVQRPEKFSAIKFLSHGEDAQNCFNCPRISPLLFSTLFSFEKTLQNSIISICGRSDGMVFFFSLKCQSQQIVEKRQPSYSDILFNLQQPLYDVIVANVSEVELKEARGFTKNKASNNLENSEFNQVCESLKNKNVLVFIGKQGKLMLAIEPDNEYHSSIFNTDYIVGPVLSVSSANDILIYSDGSRLCLCRLTVDVSFEEGKKCNIIPTFKPVYAIQHVQIVQISKDVITFSNEQCSHTFLCIDKSGCLQSIEIAQIEDSNNTNLVANNQTSEHMQHLLKSLGASQDVQTELKHSLRLQNSVLCLLQIASNVIADVMEHARNGENCNHKVKPPFHCDLKSVCVQQNSTLFLNIKFHNNSRYPLLGEWRLQMNISGRNLSHNSSFGNTAIFSSVFSINALQPGSSVTYMQSLDLLKERILFPLAVKFKLICKFPETGTNTITDADSKLLSMPLNIVKLTVLDVLQFANELQYVPHILTKNVPVEQNIDVCMCNPMVLWNSTYCSTETNSCSRRQQRYSMQIIIPCSIMKTISQNALPCYVSETNGNDTTNALLKPDELQAILVSYLFSRLELSPKELSRKVIVLEMPCNHQVILTCEFDVVNENKLKTKIWLKSYFLSLLLQTHGAIYDKIQDAVCESTQIVLEHENRELLNEVKSLQTELSNQYRGDAALTVTQKVDRAMDTFLKCRSINFP